MYRKEIGIDMASRNDSELDRKYRRAVLNVRKKYSMTETLKKNKVKLFCNIMT